MTNFFLPFQDKIKKKKKKNNGTERYGVTYLMIKKNLRVRDWWLSLAEKQKNSDVQTSFFTSKTDVI